MDSPIKEIKYYKQNAHLLTWYYAVPVGSEECVKLYINKYNDAHITSGHYYSQNENTVEITMLEFMEALSKCLQTIIKDIKPQTTAFMIHELISSILK